MKHKKNMNHKNILILWKKTITFYYYDKKWNLIFRDEE